ncbi:MAG: AAA family ATPase, partial [Oscillospiraceae bacterium]|nr:AAA family ATPase [Oscillospiraceae bacterium]
MLSQLFIQNVAVIEKATINFGNGFNVFTGETGAGKSIVIDSINSILGQRTSKDIVRFGEDKATISALFADVCNTAQSFLTQNGYLFDDETEVLVFREITKEGKSSCKINGKPATTSILKELGSYLINIHGQHDNQALMSPEKHINFIDSFGLLEGEISKYRELFS